MADIDSNAKARSGTLRCGGSNHLRQGGTELHFTSYNLRNFNTTTPITVERLTFFDANGIVLFDNVLDPNQTARLETTDVPGGNTPTPRRAE